MNSWQPSVESVESIGPNVHQWEQRSFNIILLLVTRYLGVPDMASYPVKLSSLFIIMWILHMPLLMAEGFFTWKAALYE